MREPDFQWDFREVIVFEPMWVSSRGESSMKTIFFKRGEKIISEGMSSDCAYIIESGRVEVSKRDPNGTRKVLSVLKENDIFGEMGLIDGLPRSCSVVAMEDSSITVLTQDAFNSLADHKPQALMPILKVLAARLRSTLKIVEDLQEGSKSATLR